MKSACQALHNAAQITALLERTKVPQNMLKAAQPLMKLAANTLFPELLLSLLS